jgi:hypothetical protein
MKRAIVIIFAGLLVVGGVAAQKSTQVYQAAKGDTITVSERVGCVIDSVERARFGLFPSVECFCSAVFIRLWDSTFVLRITAFDSTRVTAAVREIPQPGRRIEQWADKIDHYEQIQAGTYGSVAGRTFFRMQNADNSTGMKDPRGGPPERWFSFRPRPLSYCRTFFLFEYGGFVKVAGSRRFTGDAFAVWNVGGMANATSRHAYGASFMVATGESRARTGVEARYHTWLGSKAEELQSLEIAAGPLFYKKGRTGFAFAMTYNINDKIGFGGRMESFETPAVYGGVRLGSTPAIVISAVTGLIAMLYFMANPPQIL